VPVPLQHLPNLISAVRILLIAPIVGALAHAQFLAALVLIGAAAVSDGADGFLARRFGWQTRLGALLDPAADKLLLAAVFLTLALRGGVPVWLACLVIGRDVLLVLGAWAYRTRYEPLEIRPSPVSRLNTLCQLGFVMCVVSRSQFGLPAAWLVTALGATVFSTVLISALDYGISGARRARTFAAGTRARRGLRPST